VEGLHPVALEQEVSVDVKITAIVAADLNAKLFLDFPLVQILADITKSGIAKVTRILALASDIIDVLGKV
jgi:hypothetical protein